MSQPNVIDREKLLMGQALKRVRQLHGLSQDRAGNAYGITGQAYAKYENGKATGIHQPNVLRRLLDALGSDMAEFQRELARVSGDPLPPPTANYGEGERTRWISSRVTELAGLPIRDRIQGGAWLMADADAAQPARFYELGRDPRFPQADQWLAEVVDTSASGVQVFDGDLVRCISAEDIGYYPKTGDLVLVERTRMDGEEREVTLRQVEVTDEGVVLWMRTDIPRLRGSLLIEYPNGPQPSARITALCTAQARRF